MMIPCSFCTLHCKPGIGSSSEHLPIVQHSNGSLMHTTLQNRYNIGSSSEHLPVVQHSNGSAMHQLLHSAAHLELVLVGFPPGAPGAPCQASHRHLCHLSNNLPLLPALRGVLFPAPKGFSQHAVQHAAQACCHLGPAQRRAVECLAGLAM